MARESYFKFSCKEYSDKIMDVVNLFEGIGWTYYDQNGKIEYLPIGDDDDFDWQEGSIAKKDVERLISEKQHNNELVGLILYEKEFGRAVTLLAKNTNEIVLSIDIYRKTISGDSNDFIDASWYLINLFSKLKKKGCIIENLVLEDYIG